MDGFSGEIYVEHIARLFKILGDANRLRILFTIGNGERSVSEIIEVTGLSQTLVSFHLRTLRDAGVVTAERQGAFIYYRLTRVSLLELIRQFQEYTSKETTEAGKAEFLFPCPPMVKKMFDRRGDS